MNLISDWTVDYGEGPKRCTVPHAWRQDVDVRWEGPAAYRTTVEVPKAGGWLVFEGVSYQARVFLDNELVIEHQGIWDAFKVPLSGVRGKSVSVRVEVVKNGGATFPVRDVASGFLPFVFNTFGGIWREVTLHDEEPDLQPAAPPCRFTVDGTKIFVDGKPFYMRGVLTWGWYPELGHPNPSDDEIRREVKLAKDLGFNTIKFCLWVPSHRFFDILEEEGMFAWLELPLWDPTADLALQEQIFDELRRIVLQYRRHSNIVAWTCGCELSTSTSAEYRKRLYDMVKELTGAALVKDNSGSSEMYGGDLREFGDFYDFHPYCDTPFYPVVLDSLLIGPREKKPILLGEFNDIDVHRDLARIKREQPYWASDDPYLADQGVRWEKPQLPRILRESRFADTDETGGTEPANGPMTHKALFIRRFVHEAVRSRSDIAGYVVTGWRDTPISTAGFIDDWGSDHRFARANLNGENSLFLIPFRRPPWVRGGNRPGWIDPLNHFVGEIVLQIGAHLIKGGGLSFDWDVRSLWSGAVIAEGHCDARLSSGEPQQVSTFCFEADEAGEYVVSAHAGDWKGFWKINVYAKPAFRSYKNWSIDPHFEPLTGLGLVGGDHIITARLEVAANAIQNGHSAVLILRDSWSTPVPFWRESVQEFDRGGLGELTSNWEALLAVSPEVAIDMKALQDALPSMTECRVLINRIDTRTYAEHPILLKAKVGKGTLVATTLRPWGGLGVQPYGVMNNPAGANLLAQLIQLAESRPNQGTTKSACSLG